MNLFAEADRAAQALRVVPRAVDEDLHIAFLKVARKRLPSLPDEEVAALYEVWRDRHDGGEALKHQAELARLPELLKRQKNLLAARAAALIEGDRIVIDTLLVELGGDIAALVPDRGGRLPLSGDATWTGDDG